MEVFLVTYDLNSPGQDYKPLIKALKKFESSYKVCESAWFIKSMVLTKADIFDILKPLMDENDVLLVSKVSDWIGVNLPTDAVKNLT